jgi:hypothetical protein
MSLTAGGTEAGAVQGIKFSSLLISAIVVSEVGSGSLEVVVVVVGSG